MKSVKKIFAVLSAVAVLGVNPPVVYASDELHISTAEDFIEWASLVNEGNSMEGKVIYLDNDITLDSSENWIPIGNFSNEFAGVFDGCGHSVSGIYFKSEKYADYSGLFGYVTGGIKNLTIKDSEFKNSKSVLCGSVYEGSIENCIIEDSVKVTTSGRIYGNICGSGTKSDITDCINKGNIIYRGVENDNGSVGGIIGAGETRNCKNCKNFAEIKIDISMSPSTPAYFIGGVSGRGNLIDSCENYGNIKAYLYERYGGTTEEIKIGGVSGLADSLSDCTNNGDIYINAETPVSEAYDIFDIGGVGSNIKNITGCINNGNVTVDIKSTCTVVETGGVVSYAETIEKCGNNGNISSRGSVGGIAGTSYGRGLISLCYNKGNVNSTTSRSGGISGNACSDVENCYNLGTVTCDESVGCIVGRNIKKDGIFKNFFSTDAMALIGDDYWEDSACDFENCYTPENAETGMMSEAFAGILGEAFVYNENGYPLLFWENNFTGDVNNDNKISVSDAVILCKYLLGSGRITDWQKADLTGDGAVDSFDLVLLKKQLISG